MTNLYHINVFVTLSPPKIICEHFFFTFFMGVFLFIIIIIIIFYFFIQTNLIRCQGSRKIIISIKTTIYRSEFLRVNNLRSKNTALVQYKLNYYCCCYYYYYYY